MASRTYPLAGESVLARIVFPQPITAGIWWGLAMWSAYAIVEYTLLSALVLFRWPLAIFTPEHWRLNSLLLDCYWFLGIMGGAAAGSLVNWAAGGGNIGKRRLETSRLPATLSLLVAVQINLGLAVPTHRFTILTLAIAMILTAAILWGLRHPDSPLVDLVEFHPFLLAFVLIGPTWMGTEAMENYGPWTRVVAVGLSLAAAFSGNWFLRRRPQWSAGRHFLVGVALMTLVVLTCSFRSGGRKFVDSIQPPAATNPGRPPVVLVVFDTTRADHTSVYGYSRKTTPYLAEFAASATVFPNAMAAADWSLPTHASMFTGVYPSWHGAQSYVKSGKPKPLDGRYPTLAGILSAHGYFTTAVVANSAVVTPTWGLARGFDRYSVHTVVETTSSGRPFQLRHGVRALLEMVMPTTDFEPRYLRAQEINGEIFRVAAQPAIRGRSMFLFVNYMDAHWPYLAPSSFDDAFLNGEPEVGLARLLALKRMQAKRQPILNEDRQRLMAQYDGGIAYQDYAFHELLNGLKSMGLYEGAMIIVAGDHGEDFAEHGTWGHGNSVRGSQVNVPLVIKYPGQTAASVVTAPVSQVDLLPTILDTLGYPTPQYAQGRSLRRPEGLADRQLLSEAASGRALRWGSMKLIVSSDGRRELFDVSRDPGEARNLYAHDDAVSQKLVSAFEQWTRKMPRGSGAGPSVADADELRRLKSLGYVQ